MQREIHVSIAVSDGRESLYNSGMQRPPTRYRGLACGPKTTRMDKVSQPLETSLSRIVKSAGSKYLSMSPASRGVSERKDIPVT